MRRNTPITLLTTALLSLPLTLLVLAGCATSQSTLPSVPSPEVAASTASQPTPKPSTEQSPAGDSGTGGGEQGEGEGESSQQGDSGGGEEGDSESSVGDGSAAEADATSSSDNSSTAPADGAEAGGQAGPTAAVPVPTGPSTTDERAEKLEKALDESLAEFDEMLLREQQVIEERRAENAETSSSGAPGGSGESGTDEAPRSGGSQSQQERGSDQSQGGDAGSSRPEGPQEPMDEEMASRVPADVGDGSDDDIVARQLREAAMKEEDPELREKLWDEYRTYKQSNGD